jgi:hypothetical protein
MSCNRVGIARSTYYLWLNNDEEFKNEIENIEPKELFIDFVTSKLVEKINEGDKTSIIFALKTIGKERGWVERQEIQHDANPPENLLIEWTPATEKD